MEQARADKEAGNLRVKELERTIDLEWFQLQIITLNTKQSMCIWRQIKNRQVALPVGHIDLCVTVPSCGTHSNY